MTAIMILPHFHSLWPEYDHDELFQCAHDAIVCQLRKARYHTGVPRHLRTCIFCINGASDVVNFLLPLPLGPSDLSI